MEFLLQPEVFPFSVAITVMLAIAAIEGVGMMLGIGLSGLVDNLLPDMDLPDLDIDIDVDVDTDVPSTIGTDIDTPAALQDPGAFGKFLSWLRVGRVPVLILFIVFLLGFGLSGLIMQQILLSSLGFMLPGLIAVVPAFMLSMPFVRMSGGALESVLPKDETEAVSTDTFIGRVAHLTLGEARKEEPASAKVKDKFGRSHYIRIAPDNDNDVFKQGDEVLLVKKVGTIFYGIHNENTALKEEGN